MSSAVQTRLPSSPDEWRKLIEDADSRIRSSIRETPLEEAADLIPELDSRLLLKREDLQHTGSFKLRGATNKIRSLTKGQAAAGVVAASNGNHGLGVAAAAKEAGIAAEIYVSSHVSPAKAQRIAQMGAKITRAGSDPLDAELAGRAAAANSARIFISPYNDAEVIAGQGTVAVELVRQASRIDAVYVAVGGGGLISGIGAYLKAVSPQIEIVGCWPRNSRVLYESIKAGRILDVPEESTLSESTAGGLEADSVTLGLSREVIDRSVLVSEEEILLAMRRVRDLKNCLVEGAAAVALAACSQDSRRIKGKRVVVIICGGNLSPEVRRRLE